MVEPHNLQNIYEEWAEHPLGKRRAVGGRNALSGFLYQFYLSLDKFFEQVLIGNRDAQFLFDGLSDIAELKGDFVYLTQIKATLDLGNLRATANEALAVWRFLGEKYPDLQNKVRFQIIARRKLESIPLDISLPDPEELGLESYPHLWKDVRKQFLPIQLRGNPKVDLAIRLWPHTKQCFAVVDECVAVLFTLISENRTSTKIAQAILEVWDKSRAMQRPAGQLLGPGELASRTESQRIVHGVKPRPQDLLDGCFMERPAILNEALETIRTTISSLEASGRQLVPIFWIVGPSGAGKSSFLLQVMRELVLQSEVDVTNYLGGFAYRLLDALHYWSDTSERVLIAIDDLFDPENRSSVSWRDIAEFVFSTNWRRVPWILTCGPSEQFRAFKHEAYRYAEFQTVEIRLEPMSADEQLAYHSWYERRTAVQLRFTDEPILIVAAWTYELRRRANLSPEAFADRFYGRLKELGLHAAARTSLLLNQYGFNAPEKLFSGLEKQLDQLIAEQIYRLASPATGIRQGRFFHPRISKILYEAIIPQIDLRSRAEDLASGFDAMFDEGEVADGFLTWVDAPKTQSLISPALRKEVLAAMWPTFSKRELSTELVTRLRRWCNMAVKNDLSLSMLGSIQKIRNWFQATPEDMPYWGLLFQIIWDDTEETSREVLHLQGTKWLEDHIDSPEWDWVWERLWDHKKSRALIDLSYQWLNKHPADAGWGYVWQRLFDSGLREPDLLKTALKAIPEQRESTADMPIWQKIESLNPDLDEFLIALIKKLARARTPYFHKRGTEFFIKRLPESGFQSSFVKALQESMSEFGWAHLWETLLAKQLNSAEIIPLGRDWLSGRENELEWSHVWRRLIEHDFETEQLLPIGRDWLSGREDKPDWTHVWQRLIEVGFETEQLLPIGRDWLSGREDKPDWAYVWQRLINTGFETEQLLPVGRDWLSGREDRPEWSYVWKRLVEIGSETESLLSIGREWLTGRVQRDDYRYVYRIIYGRWPHI